MEPLQDRLNRLGIAIPEILLPKNVNLKQWAVIACDQFTQDKNYWKMAGDCAADAPSALHMILPEAFLDGENQTGKIEAINGVMRHYLGNSVFASPRRSFMYVERDTPHNRGRKGLVAAVDLEKYDWSPDARTMIRSTEGTVADRLPPRMAIRRNAPLELPHILLLIDDEANTLLPALGERAKKTAPAYSGELMLDSGSVSGWFLDAEDDWDLLAGGLEQLAARASTRYGTCASGGSGTAPFLFAVGDGNHSLASAKGIWDEYKQQSLNPLHRYALVEIENIYDPAIQFEPIHRAIFNTGFDTALNLLSALPGFSSRAVASREELARLTAEPVRGNRFGVISGGDTGSRYALVETSAGGISTACLQSLLDKAVTGNMSIDYIHGEDELFRLAAEPGAVGILLPPVQKAGFFETIARSGPLPRKSFSMGEACEKRFYIECRALFE